MRKLVWVSDVHLNFLTEPDPRDVTNTMLMLSTKKVEDFCKEILAQESDGVIITGDITEAKYIDVHLSLLNNFLAPLPIYFVLGNHDFYTGSIKDVREYCSQFKGKDTNLVYLSNCGVNKLTDKTAIIGHDGWYDGLYSNWFNPDVIVMNDYFQIKEFRDVGFTYKGSNQDIFNLMQDLAKEAANYIEYQATKACLDSCSTIIVATHIPPWRENSTHKGQISDYRWMPNFSSKLMGMAIEKVAKQFRNKKFIVLSGHSHGQASHYPLDNIASYTSFADYGAPELSINIIKVE